MATGGELDVAMFASGMALGIVLDATVIRSVLVPATVAMMGKWNWWLPSRAAAPGGALTTAERGSSRARIAVKPGESPAMSSGK
jgi:RND superfamily putative drug exporter